MWHKLWVMGWWGMMGVMCVVLFTACQGMVTDSQSPQQTPPYRDTTMQAVLATRSPDGANTTPAPSTTTNSVISALLLRLPAPLYLLEQGQIVRLETDGTTRTIITEETGEVVSFAIAESTGALGYIVAPPALADTTDTTDTPAVPPRLLIYSYGDGSGRRELFHGMLRSPLFVADDETSRELDPESTGNQLAYSVAERLTDVAEERANPGIFVSNDLGTCPFVLLPDDLPPDGQDTAAPIGYAYEPLSMSPDYAYLLIRQTPHTAVATPTLAIRTTDGTRQPLVDHLGNPLPCCETAWAHDSQTLYVAHNDMLFAATVISGTSELLFTIANNEIGGRIVAPTELSDGSIAFFVVSEPLQHSYMYRMQPGKPDTASLVRDGDFVVEAAEWAPQRRGAVARVQQPNAEVAVVWLDIDGSPPVVLPADGAATTLLRWAP